MEKKSGYNGSKNWKVICTNDGSKSIYIPELDEHYHSFHGAMQESMHVFISAGFDYVLENTATNKIKILEIGFGTGLNCYLTYIQSFIKKTEVCYHGIEAFPLRDDIIEELNYQNLLGLNDDLDSFMTLHKTPWNIQNQIFKNFSLLKIHKKVQDLILDQDFDLVYFDAFGPKAQEEMWTEAIFKQMFQALKKGGILVTYCAKGEIKRTLKSIGFIVESIPGPPGKREMTRAIKS